MELELEKLFKELDQDPTNLEILCNIGKTYKQLDDFQNARLYFVKALDINPDYYPAICSLVHLLVDYGKYSEGLGIFSQAAEKKVDDLKYLPTLFNALFALFLLHKISIENNKPIKPELHNYEELFFRIGCIFKKQKLYDAAVKIYETAFAISKSNIRLNIDLVDCYIIVNEFDKAEDILMDLEKQLPDDPDILERLSEISYKRGDYDNAIIYAERILDNNSEDSLAEDIIAYSYMKLQEFETAISRYKIQLEKNPASLKAYRNLYLAYQAARKEPEAEELIKQLEEQRPEYAELIQYEVSECLKDKGLI